MIKGVINFEEMTTIDYNKGGAIMWKPMKQMIHLSVIYIIISKEN